MYISQKLICIGNDELNEWHNHQFSSSEMYLFWTQASK